MQMQLPERSGKKRIRFEDEVKQFRSWLTTRLQKNPVTAANGKSPKKPIRFDDEVKIVRAWLATHLHIQPGTPGKKRIRLDDEVKLVRAWIEKRLQPLPKVRKKNDRLDDEVRFIKTWLEKPLDIGAVSPSSRMLARAMARYVDPKSAGPVIELGPGTGPVTEALVERGIDPSRLVLVEFDPVFCKLLRARYPESTVVQGDAYRLKTTLEHLIRAPAAAVVSSLPLLNKPIRTRLRLIHDALALMQPAAPFVQFTYSMTAPPIPKRSLGLKAEASDRIWMNLPPARVWAYRRA
jgi:phosphatidylethanolamine/phosphatidyl-N-methylethanolamine N-methyltransferase